MKKILLSLFVFTQVILNAQTFVSTSPENKNVILEEFTGINCVWCPAGHLIGQQLHDANPNDVFLIVWRKQSGYKEGRQNKQQISEFRLTPSCS